jgi:hypothetical protein
MAVETPILTVQKIHPGPVAVPEAAEFLAPPVPALQPGAGQQDAGGPQVAAARSTEAHPGSSRRCRRRLRTRRDLFSTPALAACRGAATRMPKAPLAPRGDPSGLSALSALLASACSERSTASRARQAVTSAPPRRPSWVARPAGGRSSSASPTAPPPRATTAHPPGSPGCSTCTTRPAGAGPRSPTMTAGVAAGRHPPPAPVATGAAARLRPARRRYAAPQSSGGRPAEPARDSPQGRARDKPPPQAPEQQNLQSSGAMGPGGTERRRWWFAPAPAFLCQCQKRQ